MYLTNEENKNLAIKNSRNGQGIFCRRDFSAGQIIFEVTGTFMTCDEISRVDKKTQANTYRYDKNTYISPMGRIGDLLNHSCNPNCKVVKKEGKLLIVSVSPIFQDEEVTIDYSTILGVDDDWEMKCNCGSENCRRMISRVDSLPEMIIQKYCSLGMIPDYILG